MKKKIGSIFLRGLLGKRIDQMFYTIDGPIGISR